MNLKKVLPYGLILWLKLRECHYARAVACGPSHFAGFFRSVPWIVPLPFYEIMHVLFLITRSHVAYPQVIPPKVISDVGRKCGGGLHLQLAFQRPESFDFRIIIFFKNIKILYIRILVFG